MAQVKATAERTVAAAPDQVRQALADYTATRPKLLTEHFSEYEVREGGAGAGTVVHWKLAATSKRVRDCLIHVSDKDGDLVEKDENSSMVTTWTVRPAGEAASAVSIASIASIVSIETTWNGAGGVGGFFERTFAPLGLRKIYDGVLAKLETVVTDSASGN